MRPADIHTVLVVSPDEDRREGSVSTREHRLEEIGDVGWVLDPTFLQHSFETAVQPISEYLRTRVRVHDPTGQATSDLSSVEVFGSSFRELELIRDGSSVEKASALAKEVQIRAMHNALYEQIEDMRSRRVLQQLP